MSLHRARCILLAACVGVVGCAAGGRQGADPRAGAAGAPRRHVEQPAIDPIALLTLDQIEPRLQSPAASQPSTAPSPVGTETGDDRPPVEALVLYARARDSLHAGRRHLAIESLEQAAALDPQSYAVRRALGEAYLGGATWNAQSLAALEEAARIDPDHCDLQVQLGRQYTAKGDTDTGLTHLRRALLTSDYQTNSSAAGVAELYLAEALRKRGYDTAALELLRRLRDRLEHGGMEVRFTPELFPLATQSQLLVAEMAALHERLGQLDEALAAYQSALRTGPGDNNNLRSGIVRVLARSGRFDEAARAAAELVVRTGADHDSLALLRDVCRAAGREADAADVLRRLHEQHPADRRILYALADLLSAEGRGGEAVELLERTSAGDGHDFEIFRRLVAREREVSGDPTAAAARLIDWTARHPDAVHRLSDLWADLLRPRAGRRLRLESLQSINARAPQNPGAGPDRWQAAKLFWLSRLADLLGRDATARERLAEAVDAGPEPFAPAWRAQMDAIWSGPDTDADQKAREAEAFAARAARRGATSLAAELRGLSLLRRKEFGPAAAALAQAVEQGGTSPELHFAHALAVRDAGDTSRFEQLAWKLVSDHPGYEDAYRTLHLYYQVRGSGALADKVLATWAATNPHSIDARIAQAREAYGQGRTAVAERQLTDALRERGGDVRVLAALQSLFDANENPARFAEVLEQYRRQEPTDTRVAAHLVDLYVEQGRGPEASRVADDTRAAVGDNPDALYEVAHLYGQTGRPDMSERVLRDVLRIDPRHAPAANDLGYSLAERGENLAEAERLTRFAAAAQPDNAAFLDSLGWVLYKRGEFTEAAEHLRQAVALTQPEPDPVMLDHLGDALYRATRPREAADEWSRALRRLEAIGPSDRPDLKDLRPHLERKTRQAEQGGPVTTAPTAEPARPAPPQAKN